MHGRGLLAAALTAIATVSSAEIEHVVSVREVMEAVVAPSTDVLWGAEMPMTDAAWRDMDTAAVAVIAAGTLIKSGGAGAADGEWSRATEWAAFADAMIAAAVAARRAVEEKDFAGLVASGEQIYPPCEGCHLAFHPELE